MIILMKSKIKSFTKYPIKLSGQKRTQNTILLLSLPSLMTFNVFSLLLLYILFSSIILCTNTFHLKKLHRIPMNKKIATYDIAPGTVILSNICFDSGYEIENINIVATNTPIPFSSYKNNIMNTETIPIAIICHQTRPKNIVLKISTISPYFDFKVIVSSLDGKIEPVTSFVYKMAFSVFTNATTSLCIES